MQPSFPLNSVPFQFPPFQPLAPVVQQFSIYFPQPTGFVPISAPIFLVPVYPVYVNLPHQSVLNSTPMTGLSNLPAPQVIQNLPNLFLSQSASVGENGRDLKRRKVEVKAALDVKKYFRNDILFSVFCFLNMNEFVNITAACKVSYEARSNKANWKWQLDQECVPYSLTCVQKIESLKNCFLKYAKFKCAKPQALEVIKKEVIEHECICLAPFKEGAFVSVHKMGNVRLWSPGLPKNRNGILVMDLLDGLEKDQGSILKAQVKKTVLYVVRSTNKIQVWDIEKLKSKKTQKIEALEAGIADKILCFEGIDNRVIFGTVTKNQKSPYTIRCWDYQSKELSTFSSISSTIDSKPVAISSHKDQVITACESGKIITWNMRTKEIFQCQMTCLDGINEVFFEGCHAIAMTNRSLEIYDYRNGSQKYVFKHPVFDAKLYGNTLLVRSKDQRFMEMIDITTDKKLFSLTLPIETPLLEKIAFNIEAGNIVAVRQPYNLQSNERSATTDFHSWHF